MSTTKLIYHCYSGFPHEGGGITTYIQTLLDNRPSDVSDRVLTSLKDIDQNQCKLLHLHEAKFLQDLSGECPAIYTLHNHNAYCISGTKYFSSIGQCCERPVSSIGCIWGHIKGGCGSRRPQNIVQNMKRYYTEEKSFRKCRTPIIAISNYMHRQLVNNGISPEEIISIRHGFTLPQNEQDLLTIDVHNKKRILYVGRIVPEKGLAWLMKSLALTDKQIELDISGEGWFQPHLEELAANLGISSRLTWHGWCDREKLNELYQQCIATVVCSLWPEPAGLVTLEAYQFKRAVIASGVGGLPEYVIDRETGILVLANDSYKLANAITELSQNYKMAKQMGVNGYNYLCKDFSIEEHIQKLNRAYKKTIYIDRITK
jgi:glycosyltransferase involved in cell wall biosynthesis